MNAIEEGLCSSIDFWSEGFIVSGRMVTAFVHIIEIPPASELADGFSIRQIDITPVPVYGLFIPENQESGLA